MAERIVPATSALAERERKAIEDIAALFPEGNVAGLDAIDKALGKRLSKLYKALGYESRGEMLEAFGFRQERESKGGRPTTFNVEALIAEIASRYEGADKPAKMGVLIDDNPDLKAALKTFQNKSNELFGKTAAKVLKERGLLGAGGAEVPTEAIEAMLEALASKYDGAETKPTDLSQLQAGNPEYAAAISAFFENGKRLYGVTPRRKLIDLGIFPMPASATVEASVGEMEEAIDELGRILCDLPAEAKPATIADLAKAFPKQGALVKAAKKKGLTDKAPLQELGVLAPTKTLLKERGVRSVPPENLLPGFLQVVESAVVRPGDVAAADLPPCVAGIDAPRGVELREAFVSVKGACAAGMVVGDIYPVLPASAGWGREYATVEILADTPDRISGVCFGGIFDGARARKESPLSEYVGANVLAVSELNGSFVAQLKLSYLALLRSDTMIYILRRMGIVTEADILGGMGWRFRMREAARSRGVAATEYAEASAAYQVHDSEALGVATNDTGLTAYPVE